MDKTICTARECFWSDDCMRHADNNSPNAWQAYRDLSRDLVVKDGVRHPCPYFEARKLTNNQPEK